MDNNKINSILTQLQDYITIDEKKYNVSLKTKMFIYQMVNFVDSYRNYKKDVGSTLALRLWKLKAQAILNIINSVANNDYSWEIFHPSFIKECQDFAKEWIDEIDYYLNKFNGTSV